MRATLKLLPKATDECENSLSMSNRKSFIGISVRSPEINIMKYIGATDFFVRAPFVLEGMLIGLIGAAVPLGLIYSLYNYALNYVINRFTVLSGFLNFLSVDEIFHFLIPVSLGVGVGIGFLGSIATVRKHLHV